MLARRWYWLLVAGVLFASACTNTANMSPADRQAFEGCKAYLKARVVPYDRAIIEASKLHKSGNHGEACRLEREALPMLDTIIGSFDQGACDRIHEVAGAYISRKVKRLRAEMIAKRIELQNKINRDCARY